MQQLLRIRSKNTHEFITKFLSNFFRRRGGTINLKAAMESLRNNNHQPALNQFYTTGKFPAPLSPQRFTKSMVRPVSQRFAILLTLNVYSSRSGNRQVSLSLKEMCRLVKDLLLSRMLASTMIKMPSPNNSKKSACVISSSNSTR